MDHSEECLASYYYQCMISIILITHTHVKLSIHCICCAHRLHCFYSSSHICTVKDFPQQKKSLKSEFCSLAVSHKTASRFIFIPYPNELPMQTPQAAVNTSVPNATLLVALICLEPKLQQMVRTAKYLVNGVAAHGCTANGFPTHAVIYRRPGGWS